MRQIAVLLCIVFVAEGWSGCRSNSIVNPRRLQLQVRGYRQTNLSSRTSCIASSTYRVLRYQTMVRGGGDGALALDTVPRVPTAAETRYGRLMRRIGSRSERTVAVPMRRLCASVIASSPRAPSCKYVHFTDHVRGRNVGVLQVLRTWRSREMNSTLMSFVLDLGLGGSNDKSHGRMVSVSRR